MYLSLKYRTRSGEPGRVFWLRLRNGTKRYRHLEAELGDDLAVRCAPAIVFDATDLPCVVLDGNENRLAVRAHLAALGGLDAGPLDPRLAEWHEDDDSIVPMLHHVRNEVNGHTL